ncbi:uncharacterized protein G2W53_040356 [Senna tora]|uniref:Uncharacterized protein n=1 Tax=Senna tora TaxID=362788 RepID=A0A834VYL4_9FABA|nr:uncharacterized protein G2W53_040356 [Senna tora]
MLSNTSPHALTLSVVYKVLYSGASMEILSYGMELGRSSQHIRKSN